jgi:hypothetical protein
MEEAWKYSTIMTALRNLNQNGILVFYAESEKENGFIFVKYIYSSMLSHNPVLSTA